MSNEDLVNDELGRLTDEQCREYAEMAQQKLVVLKADLYDLDDITTLELHLKQERIDALELETGKYQEHILNLARRESYAGDDETFESYWARDGDV